MSDVDGVSNELFGSEEADSDSCRRCRTLVNALDDGVFQLNVDGRFVAINDAMVSLTGYSRGDLLGEHVSTVVSAPDAKRLESAIRTRLERNGDPAATFSLVLETAAGDSVACELRVSLFVDGGDCEGIVGIVREVGDHDRTHERLPSSWQSADSIASVIDEAGVGVFVLDDDFDVVWIDETVEEYFGLVRDEVIGRDKATLIQETIRDRIADPEQFAETVLATYADNSTVEQFACRVTAGPDREERWVEHRSKPIESGPYAGGRIELYYDITDRKEAQRAREESEQRFQSLVNAVDEYAIFMLDPDGYVQSWNEGAERIKGYSTSEIIGEHFSTFYTDEDRANGVPDYNLTHARQAGTIEDEGWRVRADGTTFWANVTITAIYDDGELQGYAKVTRDMTDRREQEQRLRREYELSEQLLETSPVGIAVVNPDGSTARANERMTELLALPDDESADTTAQRDVCDANGEFLPVEERPVARVFETGAPVIDREICLDRPDGKRWLSINARPITNEQGTPEQVVETATDITDLKELAQRRKRELEEREKELAAVRLATDLLETGEQPATDLLEEFVTRLPQFFQSPERTAVCVSVGGDEVTTAGYEPLERRLTAASTTANDTPITIDVVRHDGPEFSADGVTDFADQEQELLETLATLLKLHFDRREYIDELQASNERLEQFAYAASHDLQEPLRMITSYLQLIETRYGEVLDEDGKEFLAFAVDGANRMREMIDGLLEYSRVETCGDPFEPVDLDAVVSDVLADLQLSIAEYDAEITTDSLPTVLGDDSQLRQVFQNLLENALEYSGDEPPQVHITAQRTGDEWLISVRDTGIGIDPDDEERVFEVFQRLHSHEEHTGTGIGLSLCRRIVQRHDGEIWIDSEPGKGTTVTVALPATDSYTKDR